MESRSGLAGRTSKVCIIVWEVYLYILILYVHPLVYLVC